MGFSKKRGRQEVEDVEPQEERSMIERIRNMWEFANLAQWIFVFGKAVKIDEDIDIEDLELECMKSHSTVLADIGLALLKFVSSHRGLTQEIFDEYTRRQYMAKAPQRNPFGSEEEPTKFTDLDSFTKIRVLQQLTQWAMINPDRIRERMEEQKDSDQAYWRIEPFGWDSEDRTYIVLDDNRLYRQTAAAPPPPPRVAAKKNSKKAKAALRASKRRKLMEPEASDEEAVNEPTVELKEEAMVEDDGLGGMKWECLAITLNDFNSFLATIERSRDPNEKILRTQITEQILPLLEKQEETRKRKAAQKERELLNLEKLATAKRSSRIAGKLELQRQEEEAREVERKRQAEVAMARKEQERWMKLEKERESRMMTREQRVKEREARRILHEEELAGLSEDSKKLEAGESRLSERYLKAEIEKKKQALEELAEEDDWVFDCICGAYGQVDDGSHSISCEKCNIWQHTKCVGISEAAASKDDFHFICKTCQRRAEKAEKSKHRPTIKLKFNRPGSSSSPIASPQPNGLPANTLPHSTNGAKSPDLLSSQKSNSAHYVSPPRPEYASPYSKSWKLASKSQSQSSNSNGISPNAHKEPQAENRSGSQSNSASLQWSPTMNGRGSHSSIPSSPYANGGHAFSPPHPYSPTNLPPPQYRDYTFINGRPPSAMSGNHGSVQLAPHDPNAPTQSDQRLPANSDATPEARHGAYSAMAVPFGLPGRHNSLSQKETLAHREQSNSRQIPYVDHSQRPTSSVFSSPTTLPTLARPPHSGDRGSENSSISQNSSANAQLPLKSPLAPPNPLNSPATKHLEAPALPPTAIGISPMKHSPPRPATANGLITLGSVPPSVLPPVASLPPSPQLPNLTPPVKSAEPGKNKSPTSTLHTATSQVEPIIKSSTLVEVPSALQPVLLPPPILQQSNLTLPVKVAAPQIVSSSTASSPPATVTGTAMSDSATPLMLPPVLPSSPSPYKPNLAPPIKPAEPEYDRLTSKETTS